jgi:hypothetical protein
LPIGNNELLVFQELKMGATPLREKVRAAVMKAAAGTKICFIGTCKASSMATCTRPSTFRATR